MSLVLTSSDHSTDTASHEPDELAATTSQELTEDKESEKTESEPEKTPEQLAQEAAIDALMDDRFSWYIVSVYAGMEDSVKLNLMDRVKRAGLEDEFNEIIVPKVMVEKVLKSGRKMVPKTSFPGYMFVQVNLTELAYSTVVCTPRINGFLGNHKNPKPMSDKDVLHFLGPTTEEPEAEEAGQSQEVLFAINQPIKVIAGPFANFDGIVKEVKPDQMKLTVRVSILGRETPLELGYDEVQQQST